MGQLAPHGNVRRTKRINSRLLVDLTQRMGLDPARIFSAFNQQPSNPMGLSEEDLKDPAVKFIADHLGRTTSEISALKGAATAARTAPSSKPVQNGASEVPRQGIDGFADEKSKDGRPLRPYFDAVLPIILDLFRANPQRDLADDL